MPGLFSGEILLLEDKIASRSCVHVAVCLLFEGRTHGTYFVCVCWFQVDTIVSIVRKQKTGMEK